MDDEDSIKENEDENEDGGNEGEIESNEKVLSFSCFFIRFTKVRNK